jgi:hypothetical protein
LTAELPIPLDWPWMALELSCDSCGAVVFSESVRPAILTDDAFPRLATYWRARMLDHVEKCPKRPGGAT